MIELYDGDMHFVRPITTAIRCGYSQTLNDMPTAEIVLAAEDEANGQILVPASFARILDGEEDMGLYRFASVVTEEHGEGGTVTYALEGAQCTLLDDMLIGWHELGGTGLDTRWVLEYILARQTVPRWKLGTCDFTDYYQYNFEDVMLLEAIMSLGEVLTEDYAFVFDTSGAPPWTMHLIRLPAAPACAITYGRNARRIRRSVDGRVVTRLVGRGYGEGDNQLTIASVNGGCDYLDADTIDTWKVRVGMHVDRRQTDPATLKARMAAILEGGKNPRASYEADVTDLYRETGQRFDSHRVGDRVVILDELMGAQVKARVTARAKEDVDGDPGAVRLTLDTGRRDTADALNEVLDKIGVQELYSQGATNLYSMQISDSCDEEHPLVMSYYVPGNTLRINSCLLKWKIERFRSYATLAGSGGGSARTSSTGGGATVSIPAQTVSTGVRYSSAPMDPEGSAVSLTGGPKDFLGDPLTRTGSGGNHNHNMTHVHALSGHGHNFSGESVTYSIGHNHSLAGEGAQTTGAIYSGNRSIQVTPRGTVENSATLWTTGAYSAAQGSSLHATGENGAHSHEYSHVHDMPHVHNIAHEHTIPAMEFELSGHSHTVNLPDHTHELVFGIYEGGRAQSLRILVDGEEVPASEYGESLELDVARWMRKNDDGRVTRDTWHEVEFVPDALTRITANLFFQVFIQSRGAGDY